MPSFPPVWVLSLSNKGNPTLLSAILLLTTVLDNSTQVKVLDSKNEDSSCHASFPGPRSRTSLVISLFTGLCDHTHRIKRLETFPDSSSTASPESSLTVWGNEGTFNLWGQRGSQQGKAQVPPVTLGHSFLQLKSFPSNSLLRTKNVGKSNNPWQHLWQPKWIYISSQAWDRWSTVSSPSETIYPGLLSGNRKDPSFMGLVMWLGKGYKVKLGFQETQSSTPGSFWEDQEGVVWALHPMLFLCSVPAGGGLCTHGCNTCHSECPACLPRILAHLLYPGHKLLFWKIWTMH